MTKYSNFIAIGQVFCYNRYNMTNKNLKSFTLIEMLLVVVIIGILSSILLFNTQDAFNEEERMKALSWGESLKGRHQEFLVSDWSFEGATAPGLAATANDVKDSWGYNNGTITGNIIVRDGDYCISGKCLEFDGTNLVPEYINYGQGEANSLKITGSLSLEMWIYPTDFTVRRSIVHKCYGGEMSFTQEPSTGLNFYYGTAGVNAQPYQGLGSSLTVIPNSWNHIVFVRNLDPSVMKLTWYVNGKKGGSTTANYAAAVSSTANFWIGDGYLDPFNGRMDQIRIYKGALSIADILQDYVAGLDSLLANEGISKEEYDNKMMNLATNE